MRLLHFSDLHIGVENYGTINPATGLSSRLGDFLSVFDEVVSFAIGHSVDLVILAGDTYKGRDPSQTHQREFAKRLTALSAANIPVFILIGNHDLPNSNSRANAVEIFPTLQVPNVYIGETLQTYNIATESGPIQIISVPWPRRGGILSREDSRGLTIEEVRNEIEVRMTSAIQRNIDALDPDIPAILTAHATVSGATVGTERSMMLGQDHVLLASSLHQPQLEYVALGHVHKHQILRNEAPMIVYSGSLERVDFSEEHDTKGFCVIDIDRSANQGQRMTNFEFIPVSSRPFTTIDVTIPDNVLDPHAVIREAIFKSNVKDSIVRLRIKLPVEIAHLLNDKDMREYLSESHYIAAITTETTEQTRTRISPNAAEDLQPLQAIDLYLTDRDITPEHKLELVREATQLLSEIETDPQEKS